MTSSSTSDISRLMLPLSPAERPCPSAGACHQEPQRFETSSLSANLSMFAAFLPIWLLGEWFAAVLRLPPREPLMQQPRGLLWMVRRASSLPRLEWRTSVRLVGERRPVLGSFVPRRIAALRLGLCTASREMALCRDLRRSGMGWVYVHGNGLRTGSQSSQDGWCVLFRVGSRAMGLYWRAVRTHHVVVERARLQDP
jgi:hypothetical protein